MRFLCVQVWENNILNLLKYTVVHFRLVSISIYVAEGAGLPSMNIRADQLVALLPSFRSVRRLQYVNIVLQTKNPTNKTTDGCVRNFDARCHGA